jgi:hypothetical protein
MNHSFRFLATLTTAIGLGLICPFSFEANRLAEPSIAAPVCDANPSSLDGIWLSDGYGLLLEIDADRIRAHQITSISCLPAWTAVRQPDGGKAAEAVFHMEGKGAAPKILVTTGPSPDVKHFRIPESAASTVVFRRTSGVPEVCNKAALDTPLNNFDIFWTTFDEHYPFFQLRGVDWKAARDKFRPQVNADTSKPELFRILRSMLAPLHDGHTSLSGKGFFGFVGSRPDPHPLKERDFRRAADIIATRYIQGSLRSWCLDKIKFGRLHPATGYLQILGFGAYTEDRDFDHSSAALQEALDSIFRASAKLDNLVLDIRVNRGGSDVNGLTVASRLTARGYIGYIKKARNDPRDPSQFTSPQEVAVATTDRPRFQGRILLLTSRYTVSAGETFAMALMGRTPRVERIGEATQGIFSDRLGRDLPNGWSFDLPNEVYLTADSAVFEGTGIPPHISVPVFSEEDLHSGRDSALEKCLGLLKKK